MVLLVVGPSVGATWEFSLILPSPRLMAAQRKEKRKEKGDPDAGQPTTRRHKPTTLQKIRRKVTEKEK